MKQLARRIAVTLLGCIALIAITGSIYEAIGRGKAARDFPPPGKMVDIGGRRIQLDCRGSGSPVVVFESGLGIDGALSWSAVQDSIAGSTRACTYSRAGIMWSDPVAGPHNGKAIAEDLHEVLKQAGERPPYVLVGHSLGGPYIMTFTKHFSKDVAGLVFVDASHPDQEQRLAQATAAKQSSNTLFRLGAALAGTGIVRAAVPFFHQKMPHQSMSTVQAMEAYASTSLDAMLKENDAISQTLSEAGTFRQLGNRPLFVLTAMAPIPADALAATKWTPEQGRQRKEIWKKLHDEEASWSSKSWHQLVPDSGHYIQFDRPDVVTAAILSVVNSVREEK